LLTIYSKERALIFGLMAKYMKDSSKKVLNRDTESTVSQMETVITVFTSRTRSKEKESTYGTMDLAMRVNSLTI
jgi:hypothetical protein